MSKIMSLYSFRVILTAISGIILSLTCIPPVWGEGVFSPSLSLQAGYESNPLSLPEEEGAPYSLVAPGCELTLFLPANIESGVALFYSHTDFWKKEISPRQEIGGNFYLSRQLASADVKISLGAGQYQDEELPYDDHTWLRATPQVAFDLSPTLLLNLSFTLARNLYDSRKLDAGEKEAEIQWVLAPGIKWSPNLQLALWGELSGERNDSNNDLEDYQVLGAKGGVDTYWLSRIKTSAWIQGGVKEYSNAPIGKNERRRESPVFVGLRNEFRVKPEIELTATGRWFMANSSEETEDYNSWSVEVGIQIIYDFEFFPDSSKF